jgi:hypothetical protein
LRCFFSSSPLVDKPFEQRVSEKEDKTE